MFELKRLSKSGVAGALEKAERYRLLNEAREAESICLDVLEVEPDNQRALVTLLLALTDQFERRQDDKVSQAHTIAQRLEGEYARAYYRAIIFERLAKATLQGGRWKASGHAAYELFRKAMDLYEQAIALESADNDDATLRWNTCARIIDRNPHVEPAPDEPLQDMLE
jgi:tetratricopeptide (TPR) repeat protein